MCKRRQQLQPLVAGSRVLEPCWVRGGEMEGGVLESTGQWALGSSHLTASVEYLSTLTTAGTLDGSHAALFPAVLPLPTWQTPNLPLLLASGRPLPLSS